MNPLKFVSGAYVGKIFRDERYEFVRSSSSSKTAIVVEEGSNARKFQLYAFNMKSYLWHITSLLRGQPCCVEVLLWIWLYRLICEAESTIRIKLWNVGQGEICLEQFRKPAEVRGSRAMRAPQVHYADHQVPRLQHTVGCGTKSCWCEWLGMYITHFSDGSGYYDF